MSGASGPASGVCQHRFRGRKAFSAERPALGAVGGPLDDLAVVEDCRVRFAKTAAARYTFAHSEERCERVLLPGSEISPASTALT